MVFHALQSEARTVPVAQEEHDESETASDSTALRGGATPPRPASRTRQLACGAMALSVLLAMAAVIAIAQPERVQQVADAFVSSEATSTDKPVNTPGTGCSNWNDIFLFYPALRNHTRESCNALCKGTKGCMSVNYQEQDCISDPADSVGAKACYLFGPGCKMESNKCWDLTAISSPPAFALNKSRTGCSNWNEAKIGNHIKVRTKDECGWHCSQNAQCVQFQYQPTTCPDHEHTEKGACYLLSKECRTETNPCWDLYQMIKQSSVGAHTTLKAPASAGSKSLKVASCKGIKAGSVVVIIGSSGNQQQLIVTKVTPSSRRLQSTSSSDNADVEGTLDVAPALSQSFDALSSVFVDEDAAVTTTSGPTTSTAAATTTAE